MASELILLTPCMHDLPSFSRLSEKETRFRYRHLDMLTTPGVKNIFISRSKVIKTLRAYLDGKGFLEVETPMLQIQAGMKRFDYKKWK